MRHDDRGDSERRVPATARGGGGGADSRFLDLEVSKVLHDGACRAAREALHRLLVRRLEARLEARMGERLDLLADLAADDLVEDLEASLAVEARVGARARTREDGARRLRRAFFGESGGPEED